MTLWETIINFLKAKKERKAIRSNKNKYSLHIGINNYPGTANDLRGCVNDAINWQRLLKNTFKFKTSILLDNKATYKNVVNRMRDLIEKAKKGDSIVFTYSGHGTNVRATNGDEKDGRTEALCLYDRILIDDEIRGIFNKLKNEVNLTFISDSCHSGTVTRSFLNTLYDEDGPKPRYMPPEDDEVFESSTKAVSKKSLFPEEGMNHILLSGCQDHEYSYDCNMRIGPATKATFQGAMSANAIDIIRKNPNCTYKEFYIKLRQRLPSRKFPQTPKISSQDKYKQMKMFS